MSAGTINSPQLLMLSGIGPAEHLQKIGINVVQNLRVGDNLQDHVGMTGLTFLIDKPVSIVQNRFQVLLYRYDTFYAGSFFSNMDMRFVRQMFVYATSTVRKRAISYLYRKWW